MSQIGRYEIRGEIARGGMGAVFRAFDPAQQREVALKLLTGLRPGDRTARRLKREADALTRLRHPSIVAVHEVGEDRGKPFLVLDLIEGGTLEERIERQGPLGSAEAAELCLRLAEALAYAHQSSILHRDVKPANVLLGRDGRPRLGDFGLAKDMTVEQSSLTTSGQVMGTPGYWPPEQARGELELVGPGSDVYGLGATLYATLTGRPPIEGRSLIDVLVATVETPPVPPSQVVSTVDAELERICLRCLEKAPDQRYPSASALAADLERYLLGEPAAQPGDPPALPLAPLVAAGVFLVGVALTVGIVLSEGRAAAGLARDEPPPGVEVPASAGEAQPSSPPAEESPRPSASAEVSGSPESAEPSVSASPEAPAQSDRRSAAEATQRGLVLAKAQRYQEALPFFERASALVPDDVMALMNLGMTRVRLGDRVGLGDLDRVVELSGREGRMLRLRARARLTLGDLWEARDDLDEALEIDPESVEALIVSGEVYAAEGDHELAHEEFNKAKNLAPEGSPLYFEAKWKKDNEKRLLRRERGE